MLGADSARSDMHVMDGNRDRSLAGQVLVVSFCCAVDGFGSDGALHVKVRKLLHRGVALVLTVCLLQSVSAAAAVAAFLCAW